MKTKATIEIAGRKIKEGQAVYLKDGKTYSVKGKNTRNQWYGCSSKKMYQCIVIQQHLGEIYSTSMIKSMFLIADNSLISVSWLARAGHLKKKEPIGKEHKWEICL